MPALQPQPDIVTLEQYEAITKERRAEVFDGEIYDLASPSQIHQSVLLELATVLNLFVKGRNGDCSVFPAPFDVVLSESPLTIVQPDIMVVCDKKKLDGKCCNGAPDFIIEIVSPGNPSEDYIRKLYYYKKAGVREYWIVDPRRRTVTVNYFEGNLLNIQYSFDSTIKVHICEDLLIDFAAIAKLLY